MLTQRIQGVKPSSTLRITALAGELKAQGKKVINLAAGEPDWDTPEPIKAAAIQAIREGFTKYTPTTGIPELKAAIVQTFARERGVAYGLGQVAVTCGAKQAIFNLLQVLVQSEEEVLIPSPYWVSYPEMVRLAGGTPVEVRSSPADGFRLDPKVLEKAIRSRAKVLILNSPSNPTGAILDRDRLKEIAQVAKAHRLWIVSDEIYRNLAFDSECPSIVSAAPEILEQTVIVDGVSKSYAMTGWRIGYLAGPAEVVEATARLQDHSTSNPSSISQRAALAALTSDRSFVKSLAAELKKRRDLLVGRLSQIPGLSFVKPEGAFYCFVDISATGLKSDSFSERLLQEAQVALIPGTGFGWECHVRISFTTEMKDLEEGLNRLDRFVKAL